MISPYNLIFEIVIPATPYHSNSMTHSTHEEKLLHALGQLDYHGDRCYGGTTELEDRAQGLEDRRHAAEYLLESLTAARALGIGGLWKGHRGRELMLDLAGGADVTRKLADYTRDMTARYKELQQRNEAEEDEFWGSTEGFLRSLEDGLAMGRDAARGGDQ